MQLDILQLSFIQRGLLAGLMVGLICPILGLFLVLRRYSLMADTLSHVSLAGVALGLVSGLPPVLTAVASAIAGSFVIDRLRSSKKVYGESALALFLSGSLACAVILAKFSKNPNTSLFTYLFGSIVSVTWIDVLVIAIITALVMCLVLSFFRQLQLLTFDEETARVSGVSVKFLNSALIVASAATIAVSLQVVGVLLISALMVIPVLTALQYKVNFTLTTLLAVAFSLLSVVLGVIIAYVFEVSSGGAIVLVTIFFFISSVLLRNLVNK